MYILPIFLFIAVSGTTKSIGSDSTNALDRAITSHILKGMLEITTKLKQPPNPFLPGMSCRLDVRLALPVYEEDTLVRYNIFNARPLINHAENCKKYLYDILAIKKETGEP